MKPIRHSCRTVWRRASVVLDPTGAVLVFRYDDGPPNGRHWSTPGGGLDLGEDYPEAAPRELREETGWDDDIPLGEEVLSPRSRDAVRRSTRPPT